MTLAEVLFRWSGQEFDLTGWGVVVLILLLGAMASWHR